MSQFVQVRVEQVVSGLKHLGFFSVVEAALGADMVAYQEANELYEKGFLTSSCCPAFVTYVRKAFPDLAQHVSHNLSPMAQIAKHIKRPILAARSFSSAPASPKNGAEMGNRQPLYRLCYHL